MTKVKRLIYLPDPTIKFYIDLDDTDTDDIEFYCDSDLSIYAITSPKQLEVINKRVMFKALRQKFKDSYENGKYEAPYFTDQQNLITLYEVLTFEE